MQTVQISHARYAHISRDAAHLYGRQDAETVITSGSYNRSGEDLGHLLTEAWKIDPSLAAGAMAGYLDNLTKYVREAGLTPVKREEVYRTLPMALTHPEVNDAELIGYLRENVVTIRGLELED